MKKILCCLFLSGCLLITGCAGSGFVYGPEFAVGAPSPRIVIRKAPGRVVLDGVLEPAEWKDVAVYPLLAAADSRQSSAQIPPKTAKLRENEPFERGWIRVMYDSDFLYIGAELEDSDIVQFCAGEQSHAYATGDVFEMFFKPEKSRAYWEFYATPNGKRTSFFFSSRWPYPKNPAENRTVANGIRMAVHLRGTLNVPSNVDQGWSVEYAVPLKVLERTGIPFHPGEAWQVLFARYNYSCTLPTGRPQLSTAPQIPQSSQHHQHEYYGKLEFQE